jgi:hypothetical protein
MKPLPVLSDRDSRRLSAIQEHPASGCTRRDIIKYALGALELAGVAVNTSCLGSSGNAPEQTADSDFELNGRPKATLDPDSRLPIVWIEAGVCTGCAVTLLGSVDPTIESV